MTELTREQGKKGYIVLSESRIPMAYLRDPYLDAPRCMILVCSNDGTAPAYVFRSRKQANRAVHNTSQYAKRNHLPWGCEKFSVWRVSL